MHNIAHTKDGKNYSDDDHSQSLLTHLINVSKYAEKFSECFNAGEIGSLLGLIHDIGKYQNDFQLRIRGQKIKVDHATQSALTLIDKFGEIGWLYGMVVAGHHTGLKDSGIGINLGDNTYSSRINNYNGQKISLENEIIIPDSVKHKKIDCDNQTQSFAFATYLKMLFSALVDADWTDTDEYINDIKRESVKYSIEELSEKLKNKLPINDGSYLNNIRSDILSFCLEKSQFNQGLFTLTVPTGGGKTLSSLSFALEHAKKHNLKRIIYVIPYTSIIEQNADVISKCLGKEFVLEHHSNVEIKLKNEDKNYSDTDTIEDSLDDLIDQKRIKWASENWDIPIILTTNVQFFESFFSNKPSKIRKLHNIAESVVIFDEAQMLPRELLSPTMYAISELVRNYRVTAVLCSATQPAISNFKYKSLPIIEIIENPDELFTKLERVEYSFVGFKSDQELLQLLIEQQKVLCIVNSRRHAFAVYLLASQYPEYNVYHLSTLMNANHRRKILSEIKLKLKTNENIIVISTSLIEAGVDIDFPVVVRSIAGLDSIIQAGGRANREGKLKLGKVFIFESNSGDGKTPRAIESNVSVTKGVIESLGDKAFSLLGIKMYFETLYNLSTSTGILDMKEILKEFEKIGNRFKFNFERVSEKYKIIDDNTKSIVINISRESNSLVKEIRSGVYRIETIRKLQQYSVSIYENEYLKLLKDNAIEVLKSGYAILNNEQYYSNKYGLELFSENNKNAESNII